MARRISGLKAVSTTIPIVFITGDDPVRLGFVTSLSRPGGNLTGTNIFNSEVTAKRMELLRELVPSLRRIAVLAIYRDGARAKRRRSLFWSFQQRQQHGRRSGGRRICSAQQYIADNRTHLLNGGGLSEIKASRSAQEQTKMTIRARGTGRVTIRSAALSTRSRSRRQ
jgi:ABC transporter substrate binding protein